MQKVTQEEVERFAERFYPQNKELTKVHFDAEDNTGFNDPDIDIEWSSNINPVISAKISLFFEVLENLLLGVGSRVVG